MSLDFGNVPAASTLYIPFESFAGGASITITGLAVTDVEIYKDGSTTQRASDAGYALLDTDGIDFDGLTGIHGFSVDLNDNTDAGFFAVGSFYWVVVSSITVDGQTVSFIAATFRIVAAEAVAGYPAVDTTKWLGGTIPAVAVTGVPKVDVTYLLGTAWLAPGVAGTPDVNAKLAGATAWNSGAIKTTTFTAGAIDAAAIAADAIGASELAADAAAEIAAAVWDLDATAHQTQGTFGQAIGDPVADANTIFKAVVTDATAATVGLDVVAAQTDITTIKGQTDDIGIAGAGLTALGDTRLANLDAAVSTRATPTNITAGTITTVTNLTNLPSIPAGWLTAPGIAASALDNKGNWNVGKTGYSITGTLTTLDGLVTHGDSTWATATGFSTLAAADVRTAVGLATANLDTQLADLPTNAELATSQAAADDATLAAIAALHNFDPAVDVVSANVTKVKGIVVTGSGTSGDPWGP